VFPLGNGAHERAIGQRLRLRSLLEEAEEDLADETRLPSVEAECEFIEVRLKMPMLDTTMMSPDKPALEESDDAVHIGQQASRPGMIGANHLSAVTIPLGPELLVTTPPVRDDLTAGLHRFFNEWDQCLGSEVLNLAQTDAADLLASDLHRDGKSRFRSAFPPYATRFNTPEKRIVDLNNAAQSLPASSNHGTTKLVQPRPGSLVTPESEKTLQALGAPTRLLSADPPDGQEPLAQGLAGSLENRPRSEGCLSATLRALNVITTIGPPLGVSAGRTPISLWPTDLKEVALAGLLRAEPLLELHERRWKVVLAHLPMLYVVVT